MCEATEPLEPIDPPTNTGGGGESESLDVSDNSTAIDPPTTAGGGGE